MTTETSYFSNVLTQVDKERLEREALILKDEISKIAHLWSIVDITQEYEKGYRLLCMTIALERMASTLKTTFRLVNGELVALVVKNQIPAEIMEMAIWFSAAYNVLISAGLPAKCGPVQIAHVVMGI